MICAVDGSLIPARFMLAILASAGSAIIYCFRMSLEVTIVAMVDEEKASGLISAVNECDSPSNNTMPLRGPFKWSKKSRNLIRTAFFWGYIASSIPAGRIADVYSAKWVMFVCVAVSMVCVALFPTAAYLDPYAFVSIRLFHGLASGMMYPSLAAIIAHWSPNLERNTIIGIVFSGTGLGKTLSYLISGMVATEWSWEWVFYLMAILSVPWLPLWAWLVQDYPYLQMRMTNEELELILEALHDPVPPIKPYSVPWMEVVVCLPFWAILITSLGYQGSFFIMAAGTSAYLLELRHDHLQEDALLILAPDVMEWLFVLLLGFYLDSVRIKHHITQTVIRKTATTIAFGGGAVALIVAGRAACNKPLGITSAAFYFSFMGAGACGYYGNIIDIAHNYAGTLMGIVISVSSIFAASLPYLLHGLIGDKPSIEKWSIIFNDMAGLHTFFLMFYIIFGSARRENWDRL